MYIFSFNINQIVNNDTVVLTEYPTIIFNNDLKQIIFQIRTIIKEHFETFSTTYKIPLVDLKLGVSAIYKENKFMAAHAFNINLKNVKEIKEIIKNINE